MNFSPNACALIDNANNIAVRLTHNIIHPIHLFFGALNGEKQINKELKDYFLNDVDKTVDNLLSGNFELKIEEYEKLKVDNLNVVNISQSTKNVLNEAKRLAELHKEHGQIFINEGHILRAVFNSDDETIHDYLSNFDKDRMLSIIASPRDMTVNLEDWIEAECIEGVIVRKVSENEKQMVRDFVFENFYERWTNTIDYGLQFDDIPIYIALIDGNIVGFAGYNISKQRKGYFGPLGVLKKYRGRKIGQSLLNLCLSDMKKIGYKFCIIGNASTFEFYEKACGAEVIPIS
jgi:GNAT superfamily N-acetyltransferase